MVETGRCLCSFTSSSFRVGVPGPHSPATRSEAGSAGTARGRKLGSEGPAARAEGGAQGLTRSLQAVHAHETNDDHLKDEEIWEESTAALVVLLPLAGQAEAGG